MSSHLPQPQGPINLFSVIPLEIITKHMPSNRTLPQLYHCILVIISDLPSLLDHCHLHLYSCDYVLFISYLSWDFFSYIKCYCFVYLAIVRCKYKASWVGLNQISSQSCCTTPVHHSLCHLRTIWNCILDIPYILNKICQSYGQGIPQDFIAKLDSNKVNDTDLVVVSPWTTAPHQWYSPACVCYGPVGQLLVLHWLVHFFCEYFFKSNKW